MKSINRIFSIFALVFLLAGTVAVQTARAATVTVTNVTDGDPGSLRAVIASAAAGDIITFDPALSGGTIALASTLTLTQDVTIDGSALASPITISGDTTGDGTGDVQVFNISSGVTVTLNRLVITKGNVSGDGGGLVNTGNLSVLNCTFTDNIASGFGGAIDNSATLTVTNSIFSNNSADTGGAIDNYGVSGNATISNSSFSGNKSTSDGGAINNESVMNVTASTLDNNQSSLNGGGIENYGGTLTVVNSTFYGNTASSWGGGIENNKTLTVVNSTFSNNSSTKGGGGIDTYGANGILNYSNTILANSPSGGDCLNTATLGTNLNNLVKDGGCSASLTGDPKLGPFANNGGSTRTMSLLTGSPAIDAGSDVVSVCDSVDPSDNFDQRGVTRPQGAHCDIGAYEYTPPTILTLNVKSTGAQDGWVLESAKNAKIGGTMDSSAMLNLGDDTADKQYRSVLSFATGQPLPDTAVITKVTLKVKKQSIAGGGNPITMFQGIMVDVKKGMFGTSVLQAADFQTAATKTLGPFTPGGVWFSIDLTTAKASINKLATGGGLTQIRLRFKLANNNDGIANLLSLFSGNAPAASRPQLIVQYYVP